MNWRDFSPRDVDGGPDMKIWHPAAVGHVIDPRVRARIMEESDDLTVIMVHRSAMASSNPCWLLLNKAGGTICSNFTTTGTVSAVQMMPDKLGTTACAWLETWDPVIVYSRDREGVLVVPWDPGGRWVTDEELRELEST